MLSLPHLIVLFVIALVVFGPQKLPELARMLGKATAEFRRMSTDFRYALEDEVRDLERQARIRDEEIAAAAKAAETPATPPEGTLPRELPVEEAPVQSATEHLANADSIPAQPAAPDDLNTPIGTPQEKPTDDAAV